ncbi:MAG: hypothetical protein ACO1QS_01445 [Verrucomicrobiota bacterium]
MGKTFHLKLEANDLGQLLDGLRCRAESWRSTATFLKTGESPEEFFMIEECRDAEEAESIAADYERIIAEMVRQREKQGNVGEANIDASSRVGRKAESSLRTPKGAAGQSGFGIFINTIAEGAVTLWRDGEGMPCFFETSKEAEVTIIEDLMTRLQECLEGEREFDDAITVEEYILPVERLADGALRDEWGRAHR